MPSTRPVTASGTSHTERDMDGDLYIKYKRLQKQLEFLQVRMCMYHVHIRNFRPVPL